MTAASPLSARELLSPEEQDRLHSTLRLRYFSEDWVTAPRRSDSGAELGPETQQQVLRLLRQGVDEAKIREAALEALAAEERRIIRRCRNRGLLVVVVCVGIAVLGALTWQGRSDGHHLMNVALLGAIGLMVADGFRSRGVRVRSRMLSSVEARKDVWRKAIAALLSVNTGADLPLRSSATTDN